MTFQGLPEDVWKALRAVAGEKGFAEYTIESRPISALGENSYGLVLQTKIVPAQKSQRPFVCIVKIAPTNTARREHMLVADYYKREVFMYEHVFKAFRQLQEDERIPREHAFNSVPEIYYASLKDYNEFIIFEDLAQDEFAQNCRKNLPTFDLTLSALKALAKFHAMSFALQAKRPAVFEKLIAEIRFSDNLYTSNMNPVTVEFARKYVRRVKSMLANDTHRPNQAELLRVLGMFERHFKEIALRAVNGGECAPYSVICHGDFWNNNILYRYDDCGTPTIAKLIDFQMSRYASPVLDIVHYLFACTEKNLRDAHFAEFIESYYDTLAEHLQLFGLTAEKLFPRTILDAHLKEYGAYGFCMATFAIPFFICDSSDLPDLDEVSEAIMDLGAQTHTTPSAESVEENNNNDVSEVEKKSRDLVNDYELLNDSTLPVFRRRMTGVLVDLIKYDMVSALTQLSEELALTENACASNGRQ